MERIVQIDGKPVRLRATAALPRLFRATYGKDFFSEIQKISKDSDKKADKKAEDDDESDEIDGAALETLENLTYLMARSADPDNIPPTIDAWLDSIADPTAILSIAPDVIALYLGNAKTTANPKKKKGRRRGK